MKMIDIHCHLLPGVDDGPKDLQESEAMLKELYMQGVRKVIVTPHYRKGMFEPVPHQIKSRYVQVQEIAKSIGEDLEIWLGREVHINMDIDTLLEQQKYMTLAGTEYILAEFRSDVDKDFVWERISLLISLGYRPIIAHIERYFNIACDIDFVFRLSELGAKVQVNADSILGKDGKALKHASRKLINAGLVDFVGSDANGIKERAPHLGKCQAYLIRKYGRAYTKRIMWSNPLRILQIKEKVSYR